LTSGTRGQSSVFEGGVLSLKIYLSGPTYRLGNPSAKISTKQKEENYERTETQNASDRRATEQASGQRCEHLEQHHRSIIHFNCDDSVRFPAGGSSPTDPFR
jgi:hypothetical protein